MKFDEAIKKAKENNLPHKYQEEMIQKGFFNAKAEKEFKNDFIFMVKALS